MEKTGSSTPRRGKKAKGPFIDGQRIGLPDGWYFEQRPRTSVKYIGKIDQFYYEPGTNKQFRLIKEVNKNLESKRKKFQSNAHQVLQENDRQNPETPPVYLAFDSGGNIPKKKRSFAPERRRVENIDPTDDSGSNLPKKKSIATRRRREITWGLADAETSRPKNLDLNK